MQDLQPDNDTGNVMTTLVLAKKCGITGHGPLRQTDFWVCVCVCVCVCMDSDDSREQQHSFSLHDELIALFCVYMEAAVDLL